MNILIASNSFKESASSEEVNDAIERGILLYSPFYSGSLNTRKKPICDGGTGFCSILSHATEGKLIETKSVNPILQPINSYFGVDNLKSKVFIEVAQTAGLALLKRDERNPLRTTSHGVGLQIKHAIEKYKPSEIFIGCGDSATNDFGIGLLSALDVKFTTNNNEEFTPYTPLDILKINKIDYSKSKYIQFLNNKCKVNVSCNLSSVIGGKYATSKVYAVQKGASPRDIEILAKVKDLYIELTERLFKKDISLIPGSGGAGGIAGALLLFCNARLSYSFEHIFDLIKLEEQIRWADMVITGEGLVDTSSLRGKAPINVSLLSKKYDKKVALITGSVSESCCNILMRAGVDYVEVLSHPSLNIDNYFSLVSKLVTLASFRLMQKALS